MTGLKQGAWGWFMVYRQSSREFHHWGLLPALGYASRQSKRWSSSSLSPLSPDPAWLACSPMSSRNKMYFLLMRWRLCLKLSQMVWKWKSTQMSSSTQCSWVCANSGRGWRTGKPGTLQSMGSQRIRHEWATNNSTGQEGRPRSRGGG